MTAINQYLFELSASERAEWYKAFGLEMYAFMAILFIWAAFVQRIKLKKAILIVVSFAAAFNLCPFIENWLSGLSNDLIPDRNLGAAFLSFLAVFCLLMYIFRVPIFEALDVAVPMYIGGRGITIIGCIFAGCCHGHYASWGIYSENAGYTTVPCPIIDIAASVLIAVCIVAFGRRFGAHGKAAAYGLIAFGFLRYIIDVLRDNDKLLGLITFEGIFGFVYLCIGLCMLYFIYKKYPEKNKSNIPAPRRDT